MSRYEAISPADLHTQDWLLVLEALVVYTREWPVESRCEHAEELIEEIAIDQGEFPSELRLNP